MDKKEEYAEYLLIEKQYSNNTINSYLNDINQYLDIIECDYLTISLINVKGYVEFLRNNYANNSVLRKISAIKMFYKYLELNKIITINNWDTIQYSKKNISLPKYLTTEEINLFLNSIDTLTPLGMRNKAIFELLYATGVRVSELINIKVIDLNLEEAYIKINGKGNKDRIIPINNIAIKYLKVYLYNYRINLLEEENGYLFINLNGNKLSRQGIYKILKTLCNKVGIYDVSPHKFRHSIATHMINNGANLKVIQEVLGHESIATTQIYSHISKEKIISEYEKFHNFGKDYNV